MCFFFSFLFFDKLLKVSLICIIFIIGVHHFWMVYLVICLVQLKSVAMLLAKVRMKRRYWVDENKFLFSIFCTFISYLKNILYNHLFYNLTGELIYFILVKVTLSGTPDGPLMVLAFKLEEGCFGQLTYLRYIFIFLIVQLSYYFIHVVAMLVLRHVLQGDQASIFI